MKIITKKQENRIKENNLKFFMENAFLNQRIQNLYTTLSSLMDLIESIEQGIIKSFQEQF
jgi:hypothetical protein